MTREQLIGTVAGLFLSAIGVFYVGGSLINRSQAASSVGSSVAPPALPSSLPVKQLACANVRPASPVDIEIIVRNEYATDAYRAAMVRVLCDR